MHNAHAREGERTSSTCIDSEDIARLLQVARSVDESEGNTSGEVRVDGGSWQLVPVLLQSSQSYFTPFGVDRGLICATSFSRAFAVSFMYCANLLCHPTFIRCRQASKRR